MPEVLKFQKTILEFFEEEITNSFEYFAQRVLQSPCLKKCLTSLKEPSAEKDLKEAAFELIEEMFFVEKCRTNVINIAESLSERLKGFEIKLLQIILDNSEENKGVYKLLVSDALVIKHSLLKQVLKQLVEMKEVPGQNSEQNPVQLSDDLSTSANLLHRCELLLESKSKDMVQFCKIQLSFANPQTIDELSIKFLASPNFTDGINEFFAQHLDLKSEEKKETHKHKPKAFYSKLDIILMYIHTTCVITGLYGIGITSYRYLISLNVDSGVSGGLQAVTPITAAVFTFFLNYYTRNRRYKAIMIFCIFLLMLGHLVYFLAEVAKSSSDGLGVFLLCLGRALIGAGAARMLTRKYLSNFVAYWAQSMYQLLLVTLSCIALCLGPGLSSILEYAIPEETETQTSDSVIKPWNILSLFFVFVYAILLIPFIFWYKGTDIEEKSKSAIVPTVEQEEPNSPAQFPNVQDTLRLNEIIMYAQKRSSEDSDVVSQKAKGNQAVESSKKHWMLSMTTPNWPLFYTSMILFFIKLMQEGFFTELPQLSIAYYGHSTKWTGFYYLISIAYLMPVFFGSVYLSRRVRDATILLIGLVLLLVSSLIKINYSYDKPMTEFTYYFGSSLYFCACLVAEAGASAIIPKVSSEKYKTNFFNAGMIAGSVDTIGRAVGNALFTLYSLTAGKPAVPFYQYIVNGSLALIMIISTSVLWRYLIKHTYVKITDENLNPAAEAVPLTTSNNQN